VSISIEEPRTLDELVSRHDTLKTELGQLNMVLVRTAIAGSMDYTADQLVGFSLIPALHGMLDAFKYEEVNALEAVPGKDGRFVVVGWRAHKLTQVGGSLEELGTGAFKAAARVLVYAEQMLREAKEALGDMLNAQSE
jgi:hypothetical protein